MKENTPEEIKIRYPQGHFLILLIKIGSVKNYLFFVLISKINLDFKGNLQQKEH